jgi:choline dehydrogenase
VLRYLVTGKGMLTYRASLAAASVKALEESATPDIQCSIAPGSFKDGRIGAPGRPALRAVPGFEDFPGITAGAWQMRPLSRGCVEARSPNPAEAPAINPRYLSEPTDGRAIVGGLRFVRRLFAGPALARYRGAEILPGAVESDDELLDYARQNGATVYHTTCTSKVGSDRMAVVDDEPRVHGLERLRVIDASVMPTVTSTNTNAPTIMIAERGADLIRSTARATEPGAVAWATGGTGRMLAARLSARRSAPYSRVPRTRIASWPSCPCSPPDRPIRHPARPRIDPCSRHCTRAGKSLI